MLQAEIEPLSRKTGSNQSANKTAQALFDGFAKAKALAQNFGDVSYPSQARAFAFAS